MGAPKYNNNVLLLKDKQKPEASENTRLKAEIEAYKNKIAEKLKNPKDLKKAILILEKMLNPKK